MSGTITKTGGKNAVSAPVSPAFICIDKRLNGLQVLEACRQLFALTSSNRI
jgi:hypothetical protein